MWVVTPNLLPALRLELISIHTTRVGGDKSTKMSCSQLQQFQSTPPVWVVTHLKDTENFVFEFQSTPPVWVVTVMRLAD